MRSSRSSMAMRAMLGICALSALLGCQEGPFVQLHLEGREPEVKRVVLSGMFGATPLKTTTFKDNPDLSNLAIIFPRGAHDRLAVTINAQDAEGRDVSRGSWSSDITEDKVYGPFAVALEPDPDYRKPSYTLTVAVDRGAPPLGTVQSSPLGIDCGSECAAIFREGAKVKLTAQAQPGYLFDSWGTPLDCGNSPSCEVTMKGDLTVRPAFKECKGWCNEAPVSSTQTLYSISGRSADNIVAVGDGGAVVAWNGTAWKAQSTGFTGTLRGVGTARDGGPYFAVGDAGTVLTPQMEPPWLRVSSPSNVQATQINAVAGIKSDEMFAVGKSATVWKVGNKESLAVTLFPGCVAIVGGRDLNAISTSQTKNEHFIVGSGGLFFKTIIGDIDKKPVATCPSKPPSTPKEDLNGLWVGDDNIYLVGTNGVVVKCKAAGEECTSQVQSGTSQTLHGIWGTRKDGALYLYAVGDQGTLLTSSNGGSSWSSESTGTDKNLYAVWGAGPDAVYLVGESGVILRHR